MFENFTEEAINVIMLAQEEARKLGHNFVGTEFILLGLIRERTGYASNALKSFKVNLEDSRYQVNKIIGRGSGFVENEIPFTPRAKRLLNLSLKEARQLGHNNIGTEHLLLGLIKEGEGVAARVLENLGVDLLDLKKDVMSDFGKEEIKTLDSAEQIKQSDPTVNCKDEINKFNHSDKEVDFTFHRFTERAINAIMLAQEESRRLGHNFVGTEQMLLGLIGIDNGVAAKVLKSLGVNLKDLRIEVEKIIGRGSGFVENEIPFTPRAKRVLELSLEEAHQLGHNYIGTEHLLLAIESEVESIALHVLENYGVDVQKIRMHVIEELAEQAENFNPDEQIKQSDTSEGNDLVSQLERLASLKERGLLTNKEFVEAKKKLLFK